MLLCSLGSGHGTDIVGCLLFLKEKFEAKRISATLVDCYEGWKFVVDAVASELKSGEFKDFNHIVSEENFDYKYVPADILKFDDSAPLLFQRIANADFITMVKFVSAAACRDTKRMVKNLFCAMKPGALILFVDNAAGQFHEMMSDIAKECNMKSVFGPLQHYSFKEEAFRRTFEGYESQYETRIAAEIWKKVDLFPWNTTYELQNQFFNPTRSLVPNFNDENFTTMDSVDYVAIEMVNDGRPDNDTPQNPGAFREPLRIAQGEEKPQNVRLTVENVSEMDNNQKCCTIM